MRPILCHHIVKLFQISDVLTSVQYPFICSQHVCKRHFSATQKMAQGESHSQENTFMVVGLGNLDMPKTRHSVGMQMTDEIALRCKTRFTRNKQCQSKEATADVNGVSLILIKPKLPMNLNGKCVAKSMKHHNIHKDNLILIHDNLDQKLGRFTLKENGGSHGGHNGVKSVAACVPDGKSIARLSIGIDRPTSSDQDVIVDYVLGVFKTYEQDVIDETIDNAIVVLADYISKRTSKNVTESLCGLDRNNNIVDLD